MTWKLEGTYFESCNCETACPCVFLSKPTEGKCDVLVAWHIDRGNLDGVALDGLNVALAVHSPGHMAQEKWEAAVYLDQRADERQKNALTQIFGGQAGGHPARLASHVGKILGVASVPMQYAAEGKRRSLSMAKIAEVSIEAIEGQGGGDVSVHGHPLCIAPGQDAVAARSKKLSYHDHGKNWEMSGKSGFYSPFQYAS